jgi:hypothetical protein
MFSPCSDGGTEGGRRSKSGRSGGAEQEDDGGGLGDPRAAARVGRLSVVVVGEGFGSIAFGCQTAAVIKLKICPRPILGRLVIYPVSASPNPKLSERG